MYTTLVAVFRLKPEHVAISGLGCSDSDGVISLIGGLVDESVCQSGVWRGTIPLANGAYPGSPCAIPNQVGEWAGAAQICWGGVWNPATRFAGDFLARFGLVNSTINLGRYYFCALGYVATDPAVSWIRVYPTDGPDGRGKRNWVLYAQGGFNNNSAEASCF